MCKENKHSEKNSIKSIYVIKASDCSFKNNEFKVKRKYGKFKREIIKIK